MSVSAPCSSIGDRKVTGGSHNPFRNFENIWATLEVFNLIDRANTISYNANQRLFQHDLRHPATPHPPADQPETGRSVLIPTFCAFSQSFLAVTPRKHFPKSPQFSPFWDYLPVIPRTTNCAYQRFSFWQQIGHYPDKTAQL